MSSGLLYIFQINWIITGLVHLVPALIAVCDVQRIVHGSLSFEQIIVAGLAALSLTWLAGPGAALTAIWYWFEEKMALIEARLGAGALRKGL